MSNYEKLGVFYLGRPYDLAQRKPGEGLLLYDAKDLVTHAVCVGMTGSGKTGLCIGLLEEAALDGIPSIAIDPKGDLTNLMLTFPQLRAEDFRPWINEDDARTKGMSADEFAKAQADLWRKGLADWGQDGARIQRLRDCADCAIYTPASTAGFPVSILNSFAAPPAAIIEDSELLRERINTMATSLLTLLGLEADPVRSREHILISSILNSAWQAGRDLSLAELIEQIQNPPMKRIGVLELEAFYPTAQRFELAMRLNNLLAAPGFATWLEGAPLDIDSFLYTPQGKPRISIHYVAHLSDAERMFYVALLLNQVLSWMRSQSGTTSLRAILYMDEVFGYFPPVANPPSKGPLLSLLKQARAFGLGVVLATQNPVDLDYKGLSNAGTWFLGRLQTERDKLRVLDGLEGAVVGAGGQFNRRQTDQILSALGKRIFLLHNVHEASPEVFETRWAMSYLRGPLTRDQIKMLMAGRKAAEAKPIPAVAEVAPAREVEAAAAPARAQVPAPPQGRPVLPPTVPQYFAPVTSPKAARGTVYYEPAIFAAADVQFTNATLRVDATRSLAFVVPVREGPLPVDWDAASPTELTASDLSREPVAGASYGDLPAAASRPQSYDTWRREFAKWLQRSQRLELFRSPRLGVVSEPGEAERDFRIRLQVASREKRDELADRLRKKYEPKMATLQERIRRAEQAVQREKEQAEQRKMQTAVSFGATLVGAFLGRKSITGTLGRATTAARDVGRTMKEGKDIDRAQDTVEALREQLKGIEAEFKAEVEALEGTIDPMTERLDKIALVPKVASASVQLLTLVWIPS